MRILRKSMWRLQKQRFYAPFRLICHPTSMLFLHSFWSNVFSVGPGRWFTSRRQVSLHIGICISVCSVSISSLTSRPPFATLRNAEGSRRSKRWSNSPHLCLFNRVGFAFPGQTEEKGVGRARLQRSHLGHLQTCRDPGNRSQPKVWRVLQGHIVVDTGDLPPHGPPSQIAFDEPDFVRKMPVARKPLFWQRTHRLAHGSLACLWWQVDDEEEPSVVFGAVSERDEGDLMQSRPSLGIRSAFLTLLSLKRFPRAIPVPYNEKLASLLFKEDQGARTSEVVLLQAGPSFFAFEPILKALKKASIPLEHIITQPPPKVVAIQNSSTN